MISLVIDGYGQCIGYLFWICWLIDSLTFVVRQNCAIWRYTKQICAGGRSAGSRTELPLQLGTPAQALLLQLPFLFMFSLFDMRSYRTGVRCLAIIIHGYPLEHGWLNMPTVSTVDFGIMKTLLLKAGILVSCWMRLQLIVLDDLIYFSVWVC